jgi:putative membrane protein
MTVRSLGLQGSAVAALASVVVFLWVASTAGQQPGSLSADDRKFIIDAARGSLAEVDLGELAAVRGSNDAVKQLGHQMVADHSKAAHDLMLLAREKAVAIPTELGKKHQQLRHRLAALSGVDFDRAYVNEMVKEHRATVAEFQKLMQKSKDLELKVWAGQTLPTLEQHLRSAEDLAARDKQRTDDRPRSR